MIKSALVINVIDVISVINVVNVINIINVINVISVINVGIQKGLNICTMSINYNGTLSDTILQLLLW